MDELIANLEILKKVKIGDVIIIRAKYNDLFFVSKVFDIDNKGIHVEDCLAKGDTCIRWCLNMKRLEVFYVDKILTEEESLKYLI